MTVVRKRPDNRRYDPREVGAALHRLQIPL